MRSTVSDSTRGVRRTLGLLLVTSCLLGGLVRPASADLSATSLALTARSVVLGSAVRAAGTVPTDGQPRAVRLEYRTPTGWAGLANGIAGAGGRYRIAVPTGWLNTFRLRLDAPAVRGLRQAVSPLATLAVRPGFTPLGSSADHTFLGTGRWDPCRVITWAFNPTGMPATGLAEFRHAFALLHAATGFRFRYVGTTNVVPMRDAEDGPYDPRALITVATAPPSLIRELLGSVIGLGGNLVGAIAGVPQVLKGSVVLDRNQLNAFRPGFGAGETQGALMLHELGHVMGLGHTDHPQQLMYPQLRDYRAARYGAGDLAGLRAQGAAQGCLSTATTATTAGAARRTTMAPVAHRWVDRG